MECRYINVAVALGRQTAFEVHALRHPERDSRGLTNLHRNDSNEVLTLTGFPDGFWMQIFRTSADPSFTSSKATRGMGLKGARTRSATSEEARCLASSLRLALTSGGVHAI